MKQKKDSNTVVKAIILNNKDEVLMLRRSEYTKKYANELDLPGGHIKNDENLIQGLKREVFEETGLKINSFVFFDRKENIHFYIARYNNKKINLSFEHTEYLFITKDNLDSNKKFERVSYEAIEKEGKNTMINLSIIKNNVTDDIENFNKEFLTPKETLFPKFWKGNILSPVVSRKLKKIAEEVIKSLDLNMGEEVEDINITGSIASYNWHELSDIDLHIMLDFNKIDDNFSLVKRMLDQTRINWNKKHNIRIADKEVELYFQHYTDPHEANGIWSLVMNKWLAMPVRLDPKIDINTTEKKAEALAQCIEHLYELFKNNNFKEAYEFASKIKDKIAKMRRTGLARDGIYSPENLAFKMLRNSGYLEKLSSLKIEAYDRMMSLSLEHKENIDFNKSWKSFLNNKEKK